MRLQLSALIRKGGRFVHMVINALVLRRVVCVYAFLCGIALRNCVRLWAVWLPGLRVGWFLVGTSSFYSIWSSWPVAAVSRAANWEEGSELEPQCVGSCCCSTNTQRNPILGPCGES